VAAQIRPFDFFKVRQKAAQKRKQTKTAPF
jgi:hypothetical protein